MLYRSAPLLNEVVARRLGSLASGARILARSHEPVQKLMILRQFSHHFRAHAPIENMGRSRQRWRIAQVMGRRADSVGVRLFHFSSAVLLLALGGCASTERIAPQFAVGDVAIARHFSNFPELNGTQVRVTGEYKWRWIKGGNTLRCYAIRTVDGDELAAQGFQLQPVSAQRPL